MASASAPGLSTILSALMSVSDPMFPLDRMSSVGMAPSEAAAPAAAPAFAAAYAAAAAAALAAAAETGSPGARSPTAPRRMCLDAGSMAASAERWSSAQYLVSSSSFLAAASRSACDIAGSSGDTSTIGSPGAGTLSTCGATAICWVAGCCCWVAVTAVTASRDELGW